MTGFNLLRHLSANTFGANVKCAAFLLTRSPPPRGSARDFSKPLKRINGNCCREGFSTAVSFARSRDFWGWMRIASSPNTRWGRRATRMSTSQPSVPVICREIGVRLQPRLSRSLWLSPAESSDTIATAPESLRGFTSVFWWVVPALEQELPPANPPHRILAQSTNHRPQLLRRR